MIQDIRLYGDAVLRQPAHEVTDFGVQLKRLSESLWATQNKAGAVGLAAVQIGIDWSVFSVDGSQVQTRGRREVLVNPALAESGGEVVDEEGCLSFPGIFVKIRRPEWVIIRAQTLDGKEIEREARGYLARAYLHEIDHLRGRLFTDLMDPDTRAKVIGKMQKRHLRQPARRVIGLGFPFSGDRET
jgi:peptide deformylase